MNHVIAKIGKRGNELKYRKVISDETLYTLPVDLNPHVPYRPDHNLDEDAWFGIESFSTQPYCLDILKMDFNSTEYNKLNTNETDKLDFLCSYQNENHYYLQRVSKTQLLSKKRITLGDQLEYMENSKDIIIKDLADAIYIKDIDTLFFKKLSSITGIFKGIDELYREATEEETSNFLSYEFIELTNGFNVEYVKQANRKRIAMAIDTINRFEESQKEVVLLTIKTYCPNLVSNNGVFKIGSENDLKLLLYGIEQRFYTTPDGKEKRIANSVIRLEN